MDNLVFIIFLLLTIAVVLPLSKKKKRRVGFGLFRVFVTLGAVVFYSYWFVQKSASGFLQDSMAVQVINHLPESVDFYIIKINDEVGENLYEVKHSGKIRSEHYRLEYLKMDKSDEYWVAGYTGKEKLVYFSQHSVPNKNIDQVIEVKSFINQSMKLSDQANKYVQAHRQRYMDDSVWITLSFLLIFANLVLLFKRK
ncbi:MAG: hypothetical protein Q4C75_02600 [Bergeyella zoohelcum]|nr:hypothetical protein [Bergeyella zoohelcum]